MIIIDFRLKCLNHILFLLNNYLPAVTFKRMRSYLTFLRNELLNIYRKIGRFINIRFWNSKVCLSYRFFFKEFIRRFSWKCGRWVVVDSVSFFFWLNFTIDPAMFHFSISQDLLCWSSRGTIHFPEIVAGFIWNCGWRVIVSLSLHFWLYLTFFLFCWHIKTLIYRLLLFFRSGIKSIIYNDCGFRVFRR
jgi:hypothetical protein